MKNKNIVGTVFNIIGVLFIIIVGIILTTIILHCIFMANEEIKEAWCHFFGIEIEEYRTPFFIEWVRRWLS